MDHYQKGNPKGQNKFTSIELPVPQGLHGGRLRREGHGHAAAGPREPHGRGSSLTFELYHRFLKSRLVFQIKVSHLLIKWEAHKMLKCLDNTLQFIHCERSKNRDLKLMGFLNQVCHSRCKVSPQIEKRLLFVRDRESRAKSTKTSDGVGKRYRVSTNDKARRLHLVDICHAMYSQCNSCLAISNATAA